MHFMISKFFFAKIVPCEIMCKNIIEQVRPQMAVKYGACALHAGYLGIQINTQHVSYLLLFDCNHRCSTLLNVTLYLYCLSF